MDYILSKFVNIFKGDTNDEFIFFNRKTLSLLKGNKQDLDKLIRYQTSLGLEDQLDKTVSYFVHEKFIIPTEINEEEFMKQHRIVRMCKTKNKKNKVGYLRISLTEKCNLKCSYCFINWIYTEKQKNDMTVEDFIKYMEWFISQNKTSIPIVQYFGGEPLLRIDLIKIGHKNLELARQNRTIDDFQEEIVTNGTLITPDLAK
jgi:uncharacterized protein